MARRRLLRTHALPYHLYGRSNNREWFYLPQAEVWSVFRLYLSRTIEAMGFRVDAFVLMANHYHLIAWTTDQAVDQVMGWLLKRVSDEINRRSGRIKHVAYTAIDARNMSTAWPPVR